MCSNPLISLNEVSLWDSNFVLWLVGGRNASWFACAWSELIIFIVYFCRTTKSTLSFSLSSEVHLKPNSFPRISTSVKYICSKMPRQTLILFSFSNAFTVSSSWLKVQFQKIQQLRLSQNRAQYYGGSLPNVNQIGNASTDFQVPELPSIHLSKSTKSVQQVMFI